MIQKPIRQGHSCGHNQWGIDPKLDRRLLDWEQRGLRWSFTAWMRRSFVRSFGQSSQAIQRMVGRSKPKWQRAKESFGTQQQLHSPWQGPRRVAVGCGLSSNIAQLIVARSVQGIGAAVVAGFGLAIGIFPRWCALALFAFLVPATFVSHSFWLAAGTPQFQGQLINFSKNVAIWGGLIFIAGTSKQPSLLPRSERRPGIHVQAR